MIRINRMMLVVYALLFSAACFAQNRIAPDEKPAMAVAMRANGKIYVVVAVVLTVLSGVVAYLISLDRKISRLEKEIGDPAGKQQ